MVHKGITLSLLVLGATLGYIFFSGLFSKAMPTDMPSLLTLPVSGAVLGAIIMYILNLKLTKYIVNLINLIEDSLVKVPITDLFFGTIGLGIGLLISYLISLPIQVMHINVISSILPILIYLILGYLGFQIVFNKRSELKHFLLRNKDVPKHGINKVENNSNDTYKILDSSVIIDGRIADICQTKFLDGTILIPQFVLEDLQHIADSSNSLERNRGRRGLDILRHIQKDPAVKFKIYEGEFKEIKGMESKLMKLAKLIEGCIITNDDKLNKIAELHDVSVLNINNLAHALKPIYIPGQTINLKVIKEGKECGQGIAFLDEGSMVIIENGQKFIGESIQVVVTSVVKTSAGQIFFGNPNLIKKAL